MTYFKQYKPIVLGIEKASGLVKIKAEDFTLKLAFSSDPSNETTLDTKVVNDDPWWWTEEFYINEPGEYIFHWINDNANIDIKETIYINSNPYKIKEVL